MYESSKKLNTQESPWVNPDTVPLSREAWVAQIDAHSQALDAESRLKFNEIKPGLGAVNEPGIRERFSNRFEMKEMFSTLNGQQVHFLGVSHEPYTLLFHRAQIEKAIKGAGTIVLEGAPEIARLNSVAFQENLRHTLLRQGLSGVEAQRWLDRVITSNPFHVFYREMEQLAKKHDKPVVTADPDSGADKLQDLTREWVRGGRGDLRERALTAESVISGGFVGALLTGTGMLTLAELERSRKRSEQTQAYFNREIDELPPGPALSRRKLLGGMGALGTAATLAPTVLHAASNLNKDGIIKTDETPSQALTAYDVIDYRNVAVARAIDRLSAQGTIKGPLVFIYGVWHEKALMNYLAHPDLRDAKYALYAPLRAVKPPEFVEYKYDFNPENPDESGWKQIARQEI